MPFSTESSKLIGHVINLVPEQGWGWAVWFHGVESKSLEIPNSFSIRIAQLLIDGSELRSLLGRVTVTLGGLEFQWASLIPRSDELVNLEIKSVSCNILLASSKPYIHPEYPFPHPRHVYADEYPQVRGYGRPYLNSGNP